MSNVKKNTKGNKKRYTRNNGSSIKSLQTQMKQMNIFKGEKKHINISDRTITPYIEPKVGQCDADFDANYLYDMTPNPTSGDGATNRDGSMIRLYSSVLKFSFAQQDNCSSARNIKITILEVQGTPQSIGTVEGQYLITNPMSNVRDYYSLPNTVYRSQYKVLAVRKLKIEPDNVGGQRMTKDYQINLKYNKGWGHNIRYGVSPTTGQLIFMVQCDLGNVSSSTASSLPVFVNTVNTGLSFKFNIQHYYYDN